MARQQTVTKLSKGILEMKFMKKTKEKVDREMEDAEGREMYSHEITEEMKKSGTKCFIHEASFVLLEDLLVGRLSYRGMNPEIEKLMELDNADASRLEERRGETEITDVEMAAHYNPLVNTLGKKFNNKRNQDQSGDNRSRGDNKRNREDYEWKKNKKHKFSKYEQGVDSPSVQHKDKRSRFLKPAED